MTGTYEHSIDSAGRLIVPAKLRAELGNVFYLAVGVKDNLNPTFFSHPMVKDNLTLYPMDTWKKLQDRVAELTTAQAASMDVFFASAQLCEADKQWRFQVPGYLREYAKIDRDVVITGNNDRAQIWSADVWSEKTRQQLNPAAIAKLLEGLGI